MKSPIKRKHWATVQTGKLGKRQYIKFSNLEIEEIKPKPTEKFCVLRDTLVSNHIRKIDGFNNASIERFGMIINTGIVTKQKAHMDYTPFDDKIKEREQEELEKCSSNKRKRSK